MIVQRVRGGRHSARSTSSSVRPTRICASDALGGGGPGGMRVVLSCLFGYVITIFVISNDTDTGNLGSDIGDLWQGVAFDDLRLSTSDARVRVEVRGLVQSLHIMVLTISLLSFLQSITLTRGSLSSSNGAIVRHFNTSDVLKPHTTRPSRRPHLS